MIILLMLWKFFLCTVKNNGRKFVNFALRKSIFFVHFDVLVETCWASQIFRFYAWKKKRWILMKLSKFPTWTSEWIKKIDFLSAKSNKFSAIFFHSVPQLLLQDSLNNFFFLALFPTIQDFKFFSCVFFSQLSRRSESLKWSLFCAVSIISRSSKVSLMIFRDIQKFLWWFFVIFKSFFDDFSWYLKEGGRWRSGTLTRLQCRRVWVRIPPGT